MSAAKSTSTPKRDYRIPASSGWAGLWKISAGIGIVGLGAAMAGYTQNAERFAHAYMFGFFTILTVALGAMFFVLIQHMTSAGWSVTTRRVAEFVLSGFPSLAVLFIPLLFVLSQLFPWLGHTEGHHAAGHESATAAHGEHGHGESDNGMARRRPETSESSETTEHGHAATAHPRGVRLTYEQIEHEHEHHQLHGKAAYLNKTFFLIRLVIYFLIWILIAMRLFGLSTLQDETGDPNLTVRMQAMSFPATFLFGLTLTFASFDWLMSLNPTWYSTIFGVQVFAGCAVTIFALLILLSLLLRRAGLTGDAISNEHLHDLGKLLFGFNAFWAYISFSQFFLIWYAGIPEEAQFYHRRWADGPWKPVSIAIVVFHFIVPFWFLMSRNIKRRPGLLVVGALTLLVMHIVEIYWQVLPNFGRRGLSTEQVGPLQVHWMDVASLLGVGGIYFAVVFWRMTRHPLIPIRDPRLPRSLKFENA